VDRRKRYNPPGCPPMSRYAHSRFCRHSGVERGRNDADRLRRDAIADPLIPVDRMSVCWRTAA
jgi:hypothetical protein